MAVQHATRRTCVSRAQRRPLAECRRCDTARHNRRNVMHNISRATRPFTKPGGCLKRLVGHTRVDSSTNCTRARPNALNLEALERIGVLYKIEETIRGKPPDERGAHRQEHATPLLDQLHSWLTATLESLSRKSDTSRAICSHHETCNDSRK
jgi:hypothetical protein